MTTIRTAGEVANTIAVGVGELKIATDRDTRLITYALGSCIGLTVWDQRLNVGGMLHYMLPQPGDDQEVPPDRRTSYASFGVPMLFDGLAAVGSLRRDLIVCAAGAAEVLNDSGVFAIGKRNRTMMRKMLWEADIVLAGEATGGTLARTMALELTTGRVTLRTGAVQTTLWSV